MKSKLKVFLVGKDNVNWALDTDFAHMHKAISMFAQIVDNIEDCDVIQSTIWTDLLKIDQDQLMQKFVVTAVPHDVRAMLMTPSYLEVARFVNHWIAPSTRAKKYFDQLGLTSTYIPYGYAEDVFSYIADKQQLQALRTKYGIPDSKYLVGSFIRDTEGVDLITPKYVKGPDLFLEILKKVYSQEKSLHIVLAGPRRFWIRKKLDEFHIPYTFVGKQISDRDDLLENTENLETINELTNIVDLLIVTSRMEGGPKAVMEAAATKTKVIATDVGVAPDLMQPAQLYTDFVQGSELIIDDIRHDSLAKFIPQSHKQLEVHKAVNTSKLFAQIYSGLAKTQKGQSANIKFKPIPNLHFSAVDKLKTFGKKGILSIYFQFHAGPWGGANQFLAGLTKYFQSAGWKVAHDLNQKIMLFNSFHIDFEMMKNLQNAGRFLMHRIDGPTFLIRDKDKELDDNIFTVNNTIANVSIFQSSWSLFATLKLGYTPVNPVIITNAADPAIFYPLEAHIFAPNGKIRIISTSWSDNPRKGGPIYKWLDQNLDWDRYEYTFVGRLSEKLDNIKVIEPQNSAQLAELLRQQDIYITASDNDPCSNALIEAMSCGLPAIYFNRGGHPELVQFGGLGFDHQAEIPELLKKLGDNYDAFRALVVPSKLSQVGEKYSNVINLSLK